MVEDREPRFIGKTTKAPIRFLPKATLLGCKLVQDVLGKSFSPHFSSQISAESAPSVTMEKGQDNRVTVTL